MPPVLWLAGWLLAAVGLLVSVWATRRIGPQRIAYQSALGGIMLAVMAIPVPITAFDYCMTLAGPIGVLLGAASAFQVSIIVTLILALMGQGGFTVIGLNALVLGAGAALARPLYLSLVTRLRPAAAMAAATALSQLASSALWVAILALAVRLSPALATSHEVEEGLRFLKGGALALLVLPLLVVAIAVESALGFGLARFLDRVRPDLLPRPLTLPESAPLPERAS